MKICLFGASIGWGAWDHEKGGWFQRLRFDLETESGGDYFVNAAISKDTSTDVLERLESEARARRAGMIIVGVGTNDSALREGQPWVAEEAFEKNLVKIVNVARAVTDRIILQDLLPVDESRTTPPPWDGNVQYLNDRIDAYNEIIHRVARENDVPLIEIHDAISIDDLMDGVHPNAEGHEKIYRVVKDFLLKKNLLSSRD